MYIRPFVISIPAVARIFVDGLALVGVAIAIGIGIGTVNDYSIPIAIPIPTPMSVPGHRPLSYSCLLL